jgi:ADP-ribosylglycohydrolase
MAHALVGSYALSGYEPMVAWMTARDRLEELLVLERKTKDKVLVEALEAVIKMGRSMPTEAEIWPNSGEALISFRIALSAFLTARDFRDGLTKVAAVGGDTDTYGAIAGGLLGAHFELAGIPTEWRDELFGRKIMTDLADKLLEKALKA